MEFLIFSSVRDRAWVRVEERRHSVAHTPMSRSSCPGSKTGFSCRQLPQRWKQGSTEPAPRVLCLEQPLTPRDPPPSSFGWVVGFHFPARFCISGGDAPPSLWHPRGAHPVPALRSREQSRAGKMLLARPNLFPSAFPRNQDFFLSRPAAARAERALVEHEQLLGRRWALGQSLASVQTVFVVHLRCWKPGVVGTS